VNILKLTISLMISAFIIGSSYGIVLAGGPESPDPGGIYEKKCSICHVIERSNSKKKSRSGWKRTVIRMKKNGAPITDEEVEIIIDYLTEKHGK